MYAATRHESVYKPITGHLVDEGSPEALAQYIGAVLAHVYVVKDVGLDQIVLADGWYDAGDPPEGMSPTEFAKQLFEAAQRAIA